MPIPLSKYRRKVKKTHPMLKAGILAWLIVIAIIASELLFHFAGWIAATLVIAFLSYSAGRRSMISNALAHMRVNSQYGRNGSVTETDAVSRYPAEISTPGWYSPKPGIWIRDDTGDSPDAEPKPELDATVTEIRSQLLHDKLSGVRPLFGRSDK